MPRRLRPALARLQCSSPVRRPSTSASARYEVIASATWSGGVPRRPSIHSCGLPARDVGLGQRRDPLEVAAQLLDRDLPAIALVPDESCSMASDDSSCPVAAYAIVPRRGGTRVKPRRVRNSPISTSGFGPGSMPAEQLHHQLLAEQHRRVALVGSAARDRRRAGSAARSPSCRRFSARRRPARRRQLAVLLDSRQQRCTRPIVEQAVVEDALPRAGDPREQRRRVLLLDGRRPRGRSTWPAAGRIARVRHRLILGLDDGQERGMRAPRSVAQSTNRAAASGARLAAEPALPLEERHQRLALDDRRMLPSRIESQTTPAKSAGTAGGFLGERARSRAVIAAPTSCSWNQ